MRKRTLLLEFSITLTRNRRYMRHFKPIIYLLKSLSLIYFYCIDCAEKYEFEGEVIDYRFGKGTFGKSKVVEKIQCFACSKHTSIFIQEKEKIRDSKPSSTIYGKQKDGEYFP